VHIAVTGASGMLGTALLNRPWPGVTWTAVDLRQEHLDRTGLEGCRATGQLSENACDGIGRNGEGVLALGCRIAASPERRGLGPEMKLPARPVRV